MCAVICSSALFAESDEVLNEEEIVEIAVVSTEVVDVDGSIEIAESEEEAIEIVDPEAIAAEEFARRAEQLKEQAEKSPLAAAKYAEFLENYDENFEKYMEHAKLAAKEVEAYAEKSERLKDSPNKFLGQFDTYFASNILDVGCGDGKVASFMARNNPEAIVTGIDISPSQIELAEEKFSDQENLFFEIQDASSIRSKKQFDLITSFNVMQWVEDQSIALSGFYRSMAPGGKLCIEMQAGLPRALESALTEMISSVKWAEYFTEFSPVWNFCQAREYGPLLKDAGFSIERLQSYSKCEAFSSRVEFHGFLKEWIPHAKQVPEYLQDAFINELINFYQYELADDEVEGIRFSVPTLVAVASK